MYCTHVIAFAALLLTVQFVAVGAEAELVMPPDVLARLQSLADTLEEAGNPLRLADDDLASLRAGEPSVVLVLADIASSSGPAPGESALTAMADVVRRGPPDTVRILWDRIPRMPKDLRMMVMRSMVDRADAAGLPLIVSALNASDPVYALDAAACLTASARTHALVASTIAKYADDFSAAGMERAVSVLSWSTSRDAATFLARLVTDKRERVRTAAARALGALSTRGGRTLAIAATRARIERADDAEMRDLIEVLGFIGDESVLAFLELHFASSDAAVRLAVARALARLDINAARSQAALVRHVGTEHDPVVLAAIASLISREAGEPGEQALLALLDENDGRTIAAAETALQRCYGYTDADIAALHEATAPPILPVGAGGAERPVGALVWGLIILGLAGAATAFVFLRARFGTTERRSNVRVPVDIPVRYRFLGRARGFTPTGMLSGMTRDVSAGGMQISGTIPSSAWVPELLRGSVSIGLELELPGSGDPVRSYARTAWVKQVENSQSHYLMGLQFTEIAPGDRDRISTFVVTRPLATHASN